MIFVFIFLFFIVQTKISFASDEFVLNQQINYQIDQSGNAQISQRIQLINNYSEIYPKEYQLKISSPNIEGINGSDQNGNIIQSITKEDNSTNINLKFNKVNVGKNKSTDFKINYKINSLANHKGNVWEILLPDNQNIGSSDSININLSVPSTFGDLSFSSVDPQNIVSLGKEIQINFNSENIKNKKILLIFGDYQTFDFDLKYFIENPGNQTVISEIALPPKTDNQKIILEEISPPFQNIRIDEDGNWLAQYQLKAKEVMEINISGQAKIIHLNTTKTNIDPNQYLKSSDFWPISDNNINKIAKSLKNPRDIYNYVIDNLQYNYNQINSAQRKGALAALLSPNESLCTEFTDLFITLARTKGIPAREVEGFAYSNNSKIKPININADILHAWPQYYDNNKKAWISIDPTWGDTTNGVDFFNDLDPNHFAFVFHGIDSQKPLPPGAYKNNQNVKTVKIEFAQDELETQNLPLKIDFTHQNFIQYPKIKIYNPNYNAISDINLKLNTLGWQKDISQIPPFSSIEIDLPNLSIFKSLLPVNYQFKFQVTTPNSNSYQISTDNPLYPFNLIIPGAVILTLIGIGGIIIKKRR